jgi:hypothetical protein
MIPARQEALRDARFRNHRAQPNEARLISSKRISSLALSPSSRNKTAGKG